MTEKLLTAKEAAAYLGVNTHVLYGWKARGRGPSYTQYTRGLLYDPKDLDDFIRRSRWISAARKAADAAAIKKTQEGA